MLHYKHTLTCIDITGVNVVINYDTPTCITENAHYTKSLYK